MPVFEKEKGNRAFILDIVEKYCIIEHLGWSCLVTVNSLWVLPSGSCAKITKFDGTGGLCIFSPASSSVLFPANLCCAPELGPVPQQPTMDLDSHQGTLQDLLSKHVTCH